MNRIFITLGIFTLFLISFSSVSCDNSIFENLKEGYVNIKEWISPSDGIPLNEWAVHIPNSKDWSNEKLIEWGMNLRPHPLKYDPDRLKNIPDWYAFSSMHEGSTGKNFHSRSSKVRFSDFSKLPEMIVSEVENMLENHPDTKKFLRQVTKTVSERQIPTDPEYQYQWGWNNDGAIVGSAAGIDQNQEAAWNNGYTGTGVQVCVIDSGVEWNHPDLQPNFVQADSYNFNDDIADKTDPMAQSPNSAHGTSTSGLVAAARETTCGVGAAYDATFSHIKLISGGFTKIDQADALSYHDTANDIYSNSWGPSDNGAIHGETDLDISTFANQVDTGRGGLGSIYVWAAGNGGNNHDNSNYDNLANSPYTISVAAANFDGTRAGFSEPGACNLVTAAGTAVVSTDFLGETGFSLGDCTTLNDGLAGTSFSCPSVSGGIALMLEANPGLGWRDVQHIIVQTASRTGLLLDTDDSWDSNGAGHIHSYGHGFGYFDSDLAATVAATWTNEPARASYDSGELLVSIIIPDHNADGLTVSHSVTGADPCESVELILNSNHPFRGDLYVRLTAPSGMTSVLALPRVEDRGEDYLYYRFSTVRHWDENPNGDWTLYIADLYEHDEGELLSWRLIINPNSATTYQTKDQNPNSVILFPFVLIGWISLLSMCCCGGLGAFGLLSCFAPKASFSQTGNQSSGYAGQPPPVSSPYQQSGYPTTPSTGNPYSFN